MRRNYLNVAISQLRPMYLRSLQRYNQILKERNSLIKKAEEDRRTFDATIDFWSEQLADEAARITVERAEYVRRADALVKEMSASDFFTALTGRKKSETRGRVSKKSETITEV